jgi:dTMP kinase
VLWQNIDSYTLTATMFITFEGPEGSGKSSQISQLAAFIEKHGFSVVTTREPGGTAIGDQIRDCLHDVNNSEMFAATEFLLYSASRAQLVRELIEPALREGKIVLCDRYADSTIAYQGYGRMLDLAALQQITDFATGELKPDLTFLLDIDVERGLARRVTGQAEMNRLDLEEIEFHKRVREGYHKLAQSEPQRWCIIDADRSVGSVQADLQQIILGEI